MHSQPPASHDNGAASPPQPEKDELLTAEQVSDLLKVTENTLYRWRHKTIMLPFYKLGEGDRGFIRYRRSDVLAYLGDVRTDPTQNPPEDEPTEGLARKGDSPDEQGTHDQR